MKWPGLCRKSGGQSQKDRFGERHTHTCGEDRGHTGQHKCEWCPYTW